MKYKIHFKIFLCSTHLFKISFFLFFFFSFAVWTLYICICSFASSCGSQVPDADVSAVDSLLYQRLCGCSLCRGKWSRKDRGQQVYNAVHRCHHQPESACGGGEVSCCYWPRLLSLVPEQDIRLFRICNTNGPLYDWTNFEVPHLSISSPPGWKACCWNPTVSWKPSATQRPTATTTPAALGSTWTSISTSRAIPSAATSITICWKR